MQTEKKNKIIQDIPLYALIGVIGLSIVGILIYVIWSMLIA